LKTGVGDALLPASLARNLSEQGTFSVNRISRPEFKVETYLATRSYGDLEGSLLARIDALIERVVLSVLAR